jgi:hypothetical protein
MKSRRTHKYALAEERAQLDWQLQSLVSKDAS